MRRLSGITAKICPCIFLTLMVFVFSFPSLDAIAQPSPVKATSLLSNEAAQSVLGQVSGKTALNLDQGRDKSTAAGILFNMSATDIPNDLAFSETKSIGISEAKESNLRSFSRQLGVEKSSATRSGGLEQWDLLSDDERRTVVQHLLLYQSAVTANDVAKDSMLSESYQALIRRVRDYYNLLRFQVARSSTGGISLSNDAKKGERIIDLRIQPSTRNGVEPSLKIADHLNLRYGPIRHETMMLYEFTF